MKKWKVLGLAVSAGLALGISQAYAYDQAGRIYVEPAIGVWSDVMSHSYGTSPLLSLGVGYNLTNQWGVQLTGMGGATANAVMAEGIWNLPVSYGKFQPYLLGGAGYSNMQFGLPSVDIGGGVRYQADQNVDFTLNYRYVQSFGGDLYNGNVITAGIRMYFGGAHSLFSQVSDEKVKENYNVPKGVYPCDSVDQVNRESVGCYTMQGDEVLMHLDVKFNFDSSDLTSTSKNAVSQLATFMNQYPNTNIELYGYASWEGKGSKAYNKKLSLKRAESVRSYLNQLGIENNRISTNGMGIGNPVASNKTDEGRAINRRVEAEVSLPLKDQK